MTHTEKLIAVDAVITIIKLKWNPVFSSTKLMINSAKTIVITKVKE
jgi:hypothetical protein